MKGTRLEEYLPIALPQRPKGVHGLVIAIGHAQHPKARGGAGQALEVGQGDGELGPIAPGHGVGISPDDERQREGAVD